MDPPAPGPSQRPAVPTKTEFPGTFSAADEARMHVGNNYNSGDNYHISHNYTAARRRSDATLHEQQRNQAFLDSAAEGQLQRLKYLVSLGVDIDYSDDWGFTALHHAVLSGFEDVVHYLWEIGCYVNAQSLDWGTPVCLAALKGRERIVKYLLDDRRRGNVNAKGNYCGTPLHCAASCGHVPTIEALLAQGADVNALKDTRLTFPKENGHPHAAYCVVPVPRTTQKNSLPVRATPLMIAIACRHLSAVQALLTAGSKTNCGGVTIMTAATPEDEEHDSSNTALISTCTLGYPEICAALLSAGADINAVNSSSRTALHVAVTGAKLECVNLLLEYMPDLGIVDKSGQTPLMDAVQSGCGEAVKLLCSKIPKRKPLEMSASRENPLNISDSRGETALQMAVTLGNLDIVTTLCDAGADIDGPDSHGVTPALAAAMENKIDIVSFLHKRGADFLRHNKREWTLLKAVFPIGTMELGHVLYACAPKILQLPTRECTFVRGIHDTSLSSDDINPQLMAQCEVVIDQTLQESGNGLVDMDGTMGVLFQAARSGFWQVVKVLLRQGADPRTEDEDGKTPMFHAASLGHVMVVRTLFEAGVSLSKSIFQESSNKRQFEVLDFMCENAGLWLGDYIINALGKCEDDGVRAYLGQRFEELGGKPSVSAKAHRQEPRRRLPRSKVPKS